MRVNWIYPALSVAALAGGVALTPVLAESDDPAPTTTTTTAAPTTTTTTRLGEYRVRVGGHAMWE